MKIRSTVASGGAVRIVNGCNVSDGVLEEIGTPKNWFALFQLLEYMRAFHYVRVGWEAVNALPLISGAMGLFKKETVYEVGGYRADTHAEDLELTLQTAFVSLRKQQTVSYRKLSKSNLLDGSS